MMAGIKSAKFSRKGAKSNKVCRSLPISIHAYLNLVFRFEEMPIGRKREEKRVFTMFYFVKVCCPSISSRV